MKTKTWSILLVALFMLCLGLSIVLLMPGQASSAKVYSQGNLLYTLDLRVDRTVRVETELGCNVITVRDGQVAVTEADCPDGHCMKRGWCRGGAQIVCLPNRLVVQFAGESPIDAVVG